MNRRGQFADMFITIIMILVIAGAVVLLAVGGKSILSKLGDLSESGTLENDIVSERESSLPNILQSIFLILYLGMGLAVLVSAFLVRNYPILSIIMIVLLVFVIIATPVLSNMFFTLADSQEAGAATEGMGAMRFLFEWYPKIMAGLSVLAVVVMFAKGGGGPE